MHNPCSVDGCERPSFSKGFCSPHSKRFERHGDPLAGQQPRGAGMAFLGQVCASETDDCLNWPLLINPEGYGRVWHKGGHMRANVVVCELAHGPKPSPAHVAAHSCGNRACVNPRHVRWATQAENMADRWLHGTVPVKLTDEQVVEIRSLKGRIGQVPLAARFGVHKSTIQRIHAGRRTTARDVVTARTK
jgi:hypothetical protein